MPEHSTKLNPVQMQIRKSYETEILAFAEKIGVVGFTQDDCEKYTSLVERRNLEVAKHGGTDGSKEIFEGIANQTTQQIMKLESKMEKREIETAELVKGLKKQIEELQKKR